MPATIRAGDLRHLVQIQERSLSQDAYGGQQTSWVTIGTVYAQIVPSGGAELFAAQQRFPGTTHAIIIRYFAGLSPAHKIVFEGRNLDIIGVNDEEERHFMMTVSCREGVTQQG